MLVAAASTASARRGRRPTRSDSDANAISASAVPKAQTAKTSVVVKGPKPIRGTQSAYSGIGSVPPSMTRVYTAATSQNPARARRPSNGGTASARTSDAMSSIIVPPFECENRDPHANHLGSIGQR